MKDLTVGKAPCGSCPYRKDVPSGVWDPAEYDKLPAFDGEMAEQLLKGGIGVFMCHQQDGKLCAGWVGCHGANNLVALRMVSNVARSVWRFRSPVALFQSGAEACAHGKRAIRRPGAAAKRMVAKLTQKLNIK